MGKILKKDLEAIEPCPRQKDLYTALKDLGVGVGSYSGFHKKFFGSGAGAKKKNGLWHLNVQWAWSHLTDADTGQPLNGDEQGDVDRYNKARADREELKAEREFRENSLEKGRVIDKRDIYPMVIGRLVALQEQFIFSWDNKVAEIIDAAGGDHGRRVEVQQALNQVTKSVFSDVFGRKEEVKVTIEAAMRKDQDN